MTAALAHLVEWTAGDGAPCLATLTPWRDDGAVTRYVQAVKRLPPALRRWSDDLGVWIVGADAGPELRAILVDVYGADVCASCAAGDACDVWRPLDARARRLGGLGNLRGGDVAPVEAAAPPATSAPPRDVLAAARLLGVAVDAAADTVRGRCADLCDARPHARAALCAARDRVLAWQFEAWTVEASDRVSPCQPATRR